MIQDLFTVKDVHVNTPTMLKEKTRLEPKHRRVAHKRIHSHRVGQKVQNLERWTPIKQTYAHCRKVKDIMRLYNLHQLTSETTNLTEHRQSLIDLVLTNNLSYITYLLLTNNLSYITYTEVGPSLTDLTRFHCPTYGILNGKKHTSTCNKRTIWLMKRVPMIL